MEGRQLCGCWAQAEGVVEAVAGAGEGVEKLGRERRTSVTYLSKKRRASDGRPQRSDILASRVTANNLQVYRWYRGDLSVFLGERNYENGGRRKASGGRGMQPLKRGSSRHFFTW